MAEKSTCSPGRKTPLGVNTMASYPVLQDLPPVSNPPSARRLVSSFRKERSSPFSTVTMAGTSWGSQGSFPLQDQMPTPSVAPDAISWLLFEYTLTEALSTGFIPRMVFTQTVIPAGATLAVIPRSVTATSCSASPQYSPETSEAVSRKTPFASPASSLRSMALRTGVFSAPSGRAFFVTILLVRSRGTEYPCMVMARGMLFS
ncbi:hypothetical protein SDC9_56723 [bioreactor metagenome]|uniref:Uncharacterized protein n=1 Tax=bioreactor metagenome TaxID=1076179 RepID=A0A644X2L4_9ZZZZ